MIPHEHILQWLTMSLGSCLLHLDCQEPVILVPPLTPAPSQSRNEQAEVFPYQGSSRTIMQDTGGTQKQELSRKR